jgi:hypothetical protein
MDPIWQTVLTLFCMGCSYIWGKRVGLEQGAIVVWSLIMESFGIVRVDFEEETGEISFVDEFERRYHPDEIKQQMKR